MARFSNTAAVAWLTPGAVYHEKLVIFATDRDAEFAVLSSEIHVAWAMAGASTIRTDLQYSPRDKYETFARPEATAELGRLGRNLHEHRAALMLDRHEGLTKTYNRVHDTDEFSFDIARLRELHGELDHAVLAAYGWDDLVPGHGFHDTKFGTRYTFEPVARQELLDRLLELNHVRYADEERRGLHSRKRAKRPRQALTLGELG